MASKVGHMPRHAANTLIKDVDETAVSAALGLHPELARVAVAYQDLVQRFALGRIDSTQASVQARELVARDDDGTMWTINPRDGGWLRCSVFGEWAPGEPPCSGFTTLSAWGLSGRAGVDAALEFKVVADSAPTGLSGATRLKVNRARRTANMYRPSWVYPAALVVTVVGLFLFMMARADDGQNVATGATIPASADAFLSTQ
jgi:hypothetical protein